jgi:hypothetical protein
MIAANGAEDCQHNGQFIGRPKDPAIGVVDLVVDQDTGRQQEP